MAWPSDTSGCPNRRSEVSLIDPGRFAGGLRYRTGDRVRWRNDGLLEFLGRLDEQLKINGHRIEPSEIAAVLAEHPGVRRAAVVPRKTGAGDIRLVAYVVPDAGHSSEQLALRLAQHLAERLPSYMMVASFVLRRPASLKPNGKLDRRGAAERGCGGQDGVPGGGVGPAGGCGAGARYPAQTMRCLL